MSLWHQIQRAEAQREAAAKPPFVEDAVKEKTEKLKVSAEDKKGRGRPPSGNETVTLRISTKVLEHYRGTGPGWQARLNDDLRKINGL